MPAFALAEHVESLGLGHESLVLPLGLEGIHHLELSLQFCFDFVHFLLEDIMKLCRLIQAPLLLPQFLRARNTFMMLVAFHRRRLRAILMLIERMQMVAVCHSRWLVRRGRFLQFAAAHSLPDVLYDLPAAIDGRAGLLLALLQLLVNNFHRGTTLQIIFASTEVAGRRLVSSKGPASFGSRLHRPTPRRRRLLRK